MSKKFYDRMLKGTGVTSRPFHSAFAASIMKKFGWEEGKGLGRNEEGRTDCLQIRRREENIGLGHSDASETKTQDQWRNWWDGLYNSMAAKLKDTKMTECSDGSSSDSDEDDKAVKCRKVSEMRKKITVVTSCQTITTNRHRDAETLSEEGSTSADTPISQTDTSSSASFSCFSSHVLAEINDREGKTFDHDKDREFDEEVSDSLVKKKDKKKKKRKSERDLDETPDACDSSGSPDTLTGEPIKEKSKKSKKKADPQGESQEAEEPDAEPCCSEVRGEPDDAACAEEVGEKKKKKKKRRREISEGEMLEDGDEVQVHEKFSKQKRKKNKESS